MSKFRCFVSMALLMLAGLGAARAEDRVLVPGDLPLTQGMVDDYCRYVAWRWPRPSWTLKQAITSTSSLIQTVLPARKC